MTTRICPLIGRLTLILFLASYLTAGLAEEQTVEIKKTDRCPVCGMFVYKYPKWVAQIYFQDGSSYFYDGAKDMFKHIFDTGKYTPGKTSDNIKAIFVTDYYEVELIEAKSAFYVVGSDVLGRWDMSCYLSKTRNPRRSFWKTIKANQLYDFRM